MEINDDLILRLEELARLQLSEAERTELRGDLEKMLRMVGKLSDLNVDGVEPLVYLNEATGPPRTDEVAHQLERHTALQNAPDTDGEFFRVPKVIQ